MVKPCGGPAASTLAWYTGLSGTEIREGAPDGPVLGRFNTPQGLLDVTPAYNRVYYLFGYRDGAWVELDGLTVPADRTGCDMMKSQ